MNVMISYGFPDFLGRIDPEKWILRRIPYLQSAPSQHGSPHFSNRRGWSRVSWETKGKKLEWWDIPMSEQRERRTCTQEYQQGFYSPKASLGELTTSEYGKKSISICSAPSIVASEAFEHFVCQGSLQSGKTVRFDASDSVSWQNHQNL